MSSLVRQSLSCTTGICRSAGCIDALANLTRAALEASEREPDTRRAMEAAADAHMALVALWRLLSQPASDAASPGSSSDGSSLCAGISSHIILIYETTILCSWSWTVTPCSHLLHQLVYVLR